MVHSQSARLGYPLVMRLLHWLTAFIMITMILAGIYMVHGPWEGKFPASRGWLVDYHRGMGFVLMVLVILRLLAYRFSPPPSPLPVTMRAGHKAFARCVHFLLYAALILHPLFGWYATNVWGVKAIPVFGLFNLPSLAGKDRELGNLLLSWHGTIGFFITFLIVLHIAGALYHKLIVRDGVFERMIRR